jgi:hypothetical protein
VVQDHNVATANDVSILLKGEEALERHERVAKQPSPPVDDRASVPAVAIAEGDDYSPTIEVEHRDLLKGLEKIVRR